MNDDPLALISVDPAVCHGQPCIKGTRVMVTVVLDALAAGLETEGIVRHYPTLNTQGARAAIAYGAWLAKQEVRPLTPSTVVAKDLLVASASQPPSVSSIPTDR